MPTTIPHLLVTASGTLGHTPNENEIWSFGIKMMVSDSTSGGAALVPTAADVAAVGPIALAALVDYIPYENAPGNTGTAIITDWARLTGVKVSAVAANMKNDPLIDPYSVDVTPPVTGGFNVPTSGSGVGGQVPYTVAFAISLRGTTYLRGSASHGRFYVPAPYLQGGLSAPNPMVNGLMDPNSVELQVNSAFVMLSAMNGAELATGRFAKAALIGTSADLAGARWQHVSSVQADSRPDTIRRRGDSIAGLSVQAQGGL